MVAQLSPGQDGQVSIGDAAEKAAGPVVLQVLPALETGGVERGTVDIAAAIMAAGGQAIVASEGGQMERHLTRVGALHVRLPMASKNPLVMWRNVERLAELIRRHDVQIVHARSRAPAWSARAAARRTGRHFITTFHGTYNTRGLFKRRYNAVMTSGEKVIANSQFIARHIAEVYGVEAARTAVIQRGVDLAIFNPEAVSVQRIVKLATDWRVPDGTPLIMLPARFTRWKGQRLLLDALPHLADLNFCCVFIGADQGRSAYRQELESVIAKRGLQSRAFLLDHCNDMAAAYMLADVVISASTDPEAFGRVVSEAQAMGRPVVAADHGGVREQVIPDVTAFLFEPASAEGLAAALRRALQLSPEERRHVSSQAEVHARHNFSKERMCALTLNIYQELLRADPAGS